MFIEHRTYQLRTGAINEYFAAFGRIGFELQVAHGAECVGHYVTEAGPQSQIVALWKHRSFEERLEGRRQLGQNAQWQQIMGKVRPIIHGIETKLLLPSPVWTD